MEVNLSNSVVPQACNVILQRMHIYKVILSHSNGSSSARRLELDGRLHNYEYYQIFKLSSQIAGIWNITLVILLIRALQILYKFGNEHF